jgi:hypothetical protein
MIPDLLRSPVCDASAFDPWWWPAHTAGMRYDWGVEAGESERLQLRGRRPTRSDYPGFCGSVASKGGGVFVISTRPSSGSFPSPSGTILYKILKASDILPDAHITDLVKFRGPGPDTSRDRGLGLPEWRASLDCLVREVAVLRPRRFLVVPGAWEWVKGWVERREFGRWGNGLAPEHRDLLARLREEGRVVPFWNSRKLWSEVVADWRAGYLPVQN